MPNAPWDARSPTEQRRLQNVLLKQTILQMALAHVPYVRSKLSAAGIDARLFRGLDQLERLPLTSRRDVVDPRRNPEGVRAVLLHGTAEGVKRFSDRRTLRRVAAARWVGGEELQQMMIEAATRPIHMHLADGPGGRIPVGYTRDDLDLLARAGARLAQLLGIEREDRLLNLVPFGPTIAFWGLFYMAHGTGMTALHVRTQGGDLGRALATFEDAAPTAVAVVADEALEALAGLADRADLSGLRTLVVAGRSLTITERASLGEALIGAGAGDASIACVYAPAEGRVLWGECAVPAGRTETFGFHTFPDMDVLEVVSPETGERVPEQSAGEIVVTPLGFRGGGVPRWRTGDLATAGMTTATCPNCARNLPRVGPTVVPGAWRRRVALDGRSSVIDLRDVASAAAERARLWQVELTGANGSDELFVYLARTEDPSPVISLYEDLGRLRAAPTQIVLGSEDEVGARLEAAPGPWPRLLERG